MDQPEKRPQPSWQPSQQSLEPPAKKLRLSPPPNPYVNGGRPNYQRPTSYSTSPNVSNFNLPNAYTTPRAPLTNGYQSNSFARQNMPPPQRPAARPIEKPAVEQEEAQERYMDINDLSDAVLSSGVDMRHEEEVLAQSYQSRQSFQSAQSSSGPSNFDLLSSGSFGGIGSKGTLSQQPHKTAEQIIEEKHKRATWNYNKKRQAHLDDPFLQGNSMRVRVERICQDHGVKMQMEGLYDKKTPDRPNAVVMSGAGREAAGILAAKAPSILHRGYPLEGIFTLLSLATNERIRGLLEDSYGVARGRRQTSNGIVPPEWADIAVSANGTIEAQTTQTIPPESITGTSWDQPPDTNGQPQQPQPTIQFPPRSTPLAKCLSTLAKQDREAEEARIKKRAARKARKAAAAAGNANGEGSADGTGLLGEKAPEVKMTKKEREKLAKQDVSEEVATRNANTTAALALGNANKYSWMTKATTGSKPGGLGGPKIGAPGLGGLGSSSSKASGAVGKDGLPPPSSDRKFGTWREDGPGSKDVQMRDWISVLETDGRERKTLCFAMSKLGREAQQE